jgi:hypothetical protein
MSRISVSNGRISMRIISQNGEFDFPYEHTLIRATDRAIYSRFGTDARDILIGVYGNEDSVKRAMNRLFTYVGTNMPCYQFPMPEELEK